MLIHDFINAVRRRDYAALCGGSELAKSLATHDVSKLYFEGAVEMFLRALEVTCVAKATFPAALFAFDPEGGDWKVKRFPDYDATSKDDMILMQKVWIGMSLEEGDHQAVLMVQEAWVKLCPVAEEDMREVQKRLDRLHASKGAAGMSGTRDAVVAELFFRDMPYTRVNFTAVLDSDRDIEDVVVTARKIEDEKGFMSTEVH